ncbi:hypothetical protein KP509_09G019300 [Ceratopteris richardii]|uniref:BFN domain-containing protein n=1 Tax=Ceratopteris richardii TaxID=49495 RepID=A0A8T2U8F9_CERRI|nr:hypothetical protein KP509_09G019300 [Ceratopteris richardii]
MDNLFATPTSQSSYMCDHMYASCYFSVGSPTRVLAELSWRPRPFPHWGAALKLRSLPLSIRCSSNSSANRNNGYGGAYNSDWRSEDDSFQYLEAEVVEAVSLLPSHGHLFMTLANGGEVEVNHVNPPKGRLLYRTRNPTIFLKIIAESELILPIIVGDIAVGMLMKALHGDEGVVRPNQYHLMREMVSSLNFEVRMVRVTERVADTYLSRIFIAKPGEDAMMSVDARPSDAINLAVRCKVPIFVNKDIVYADAVRPVQVAAQGTAVMLKHGTLTLDCPEDGPDLVAEEITLVKNMLIAVVEERYNDAAHWRNSLNEHRAQHP